MKLTKSFVLSSLILSSFGVMTAVSDLPQVHAAMREEMQTTLTERRDKEQLLAQQTRSNDSMTVTIQGCNRVGGDVICNLTLTSKIDQSFEIWSRTLLYDRFGNFYDASDDKIANRDGYVPFLKGIPLRATITFKDIPSQVKEASAIIVSIYGSGEFQFRGIKISE